MKLRNFYQNIFSVFEIQNDEKYGIKFHSGANEVKLIIELDQEFPYKIPKLTLEPNLNHSWIENGEITKFAGLRNVSRFIKLKWKNIGTSISFLLVYIKLGPWTRLSGDNS